MKRGRYILFTMIVMLCCTHMWGQDGSGDVVVHGDPRLGLLLKKERTAAAKITAREHAAAKIRTVDNAKPIASAAILPGKTNIGVVNKPVAAVTNGGAVPIKPASGNAAAPTQSKPIASVAAPSPTKPTLASTNAATAAVATAAAHEATTTQVKMAPRYNFRPPGKVIYSGKGYRVQIYNGPDRDKALEIKMEFSRSNPAVRTYLSYVSPCFRVKVGNYKHRTDAEGMYREAKSMYTPCMIVPDLVTISTY